MRETTLRSPRWPLAIAAGLCLLAMGAPCHARSRAHSYRARSHPIHRTASYHRALFRPRTVHRAALRPARVPRAHTRPISPSVSRVRIHRTARPTYYRSGVREHRSETAKKQFLRQRGLTRVPPGMEVDHIVPLSEGGADTPANMELITKSAHHRKTAAEAKRYGWHKRR